MFLPLILLLVIMSVSDGRYDVASLLLSEYVDSVIADAAGMLQRPGNAADTVPLAYLRVLLYLAGNALRRDAFPGARSLVEQSPTVVHVGSLPCPSMSTPVSSAGVHTIAVTPSDVPLFRKLPR